MTWFTRRQAPTPVNPMRPDVQPASGAPDLPSDALSLRALSRHSPGLVGQFMWGANTAPVTPDPLFLHVGCGENVLDGFVNLDFIPHDARVHRFEFLDPWPEAWAGRAEGIFAEDVLEHFFFGEQAYVLCNANRMLRAGGVARILMPSYTKLVRYGESFVPAATDTMHTAFGVDTGADAVNMGMRFSGHRWLHSEESLAALAAMCGFRAEPTSCAHSSVARFNGLNLRDETNSLSFATDLHRERPVLRLHVEPTAVVNASKVEDLPNGAALYRSNAVRPMVVYTLPHPVAAQDCALLNVRSANLSSFQEHNQKWLVLDDARRDDQWHFDETLKSRPCMNIVTRNQLGMLLAGAREFSRLVFSPAAGSDEYFTLGGVEVYVLGAFGDPAPAIV